MMAEGNWQSKGRQVKEVHQWRAQRSHYGELVQWDTSDHDWLEGRGEAVHHLVGMIDDATSRSWGRFVQRDGTRENMGVLWEYVTRFGRAVDYYTDRDSMFSVAPSMRFLRHGGIYLVRWGSTSKTKVKTKSWVGTTPPPAGRPRAQAKERAGRNTLFLIVRR
jgi:hypothetical protein